jgi:hypothetical protein
MRTYTEHTYLAKRTVNALTHVKCDKCGKDLGSFDLNNKGFYAGVKYKHTDLPKKRVWYMCKRIQNTPYDQEKGYHEKDFDICPDCFPAFMEGFRDLCGWDDDNMEIHVHHMVEYEKELEESNDESENT